MLENYNICDTLFLLLRFSKNHKLVDVNVLDARFMRERDKKQNSVSFTTKMMHHKIHIFVLYIE